MTVSLKNDSYNRLVIKDACNLSEEDKALASNWIVEKYKLSGKKDIVIVNIGTDCVVGDSYGPLVGSMLSDRGSSLCVYGTLEKPLHALNLEHETNRIRDAHKESFIVAIDASVTNNKDNLLGLVLSNKGVRPGLASGKILSAVGDISILCNVSLAGKSDAFSMTSILRRISVRTIYSLSKHTSSVLEKVEHALKLA